MVDMGHYLADEPLGDLPPLAEMAFLPRHAFLGGQGADEHPAPPEKRVRLYVWMYHR